MAWKERVNSYLSEFVVEPEGDWNAYEMHKKELRKLCYGDNEDYPIRYDWAIGRLLDFMRRNKENERKNN